MSDDKIINFNFKYSASRMDNMLQRANNDYYEKDRIPSPDGLNYKDGCYVTCAVMCVDIRGSSQLPTQHTMPILAKIYRTYISELIALIKSCKLHRHIRIDGDAVMGIFDVPQPTAHLNEIFELAARASSLIQILNYKLEKQGYVPLRIGIGLSFGRVLMIKAGLFGSGHNDIVWMGDAVNRASKLSSYGNKEPQHDGEVMVSNRFHEKLHPTYHGYLMWSAYRQCYTGKICNKEMQAFYEEMKNPNPKPVYHAPPPPPIMNTPPPYTSPAPFSLAPTNMSSLAQIANLFNPPSPLEKGSNLADLLNHFYKK